MLLKPQTAARLVSLGGILAALIVLLIGASALTPTADLAVFTLTSLVMAVAVIELGQQKAWLVLLAATAVSLIWPGWLLSYPFWTFFGLFPLLKAVLESRLPVWPARLVKLLAANVLLIATAFIFVRGLLFAQVALYGWWLWPVLLVGLQVVILLYDYALSVMITFYLNRLHDKIRRRS